MQMILADIVESQFVRRSLKEEAEVLDRTNIDLLRSGCHVADGHIVDHALT